MNLPKLETQKVNREQWQGFLGYHHTDAALENEFYEMQNLCADEASFLMPRKPRGKVAQLEKPNGLYGIEQLLWVDGTRLFYNQRYVGEVGDCEKTMVAMGSQVVILPDKLVFHTQDLSLVPIEAKFSTVGHTHFKLAMADGSLPEQYSIADTPPQEPEGGALWIDSSVVPQVLKQFSAYSGAWVEIMTTYIRIESPGIGALFSAYDGVEISGCVIEDINTKTFLQEVGEDYIVVPGIVDAVVSQEQSVTVSRTMPNLAYMVEYNNRLWGCSPDGREIYCCKLGDPFNWNAFLGLSSDSYALSVGSPGKFTGAATYGGTVLFFKEDCVHKIFGAKPSNYQATLVHLHGIAPGCGKSVVHAEGILFYMSTAGYCAYTGAMPEVLSRKLGQGLYDAAAGSVGSKVYVAAKRDRGTHLFCYDIQSGLWHRQDDLAVMQFAAINDALYLMDTQGQILLVDADPEDANVLEMESDVCWYAQTGEIGLVEPNAKYISRLQTRFEMEEGTALGIDICYDEGTWQQVFRTDATVRKTYVLPILPRRATTMRIRFVGKGKCKVFSMSKVKEQGSDVLL